MPIDNTTMLGAFLVAYQYQRRQRQRRLALIIAAVIKKRRLEGIDERGPFAENEVGLDEENEYEDEYELEATPTPLPRPPPSTQEEPNTTESRRRKRAASEDMAQKMLRRSEMYMYDKQRAVSSRWVPC